VNIGGGIITNPYILFITNGGYADINEIFASTKVNIKKYYWRVVGLSIVVS